jgi:formylmethanofuran dehydrogenase subunit E
MMPYDIFQIPNDILNRGIECEITKKPFRIIASELEFYRKHNLPIPKRHPDQRHIDRLKQRNPRKLFSRICDKCHKEIKSSYSSERKEIIYCEGCYNEYFIN